MKKILLILAAVALISMPFIMSSCEEDSALSCTELISKISKTQTAYYLDSDNSSKCNDYKKAIKAYLDSDCDNLDSSYQTIYNSLICD
ncbi:MAG: hypothetical protein A2W99_02290 [Bacteroidetes bacterium GWF2_33_16]|nr:MAG: hypothetical protein A2X00_15865 [Bacteroidetes bacterium GWE2_32_14]OFY07092.1 MAG: hypothetical protein A2W99_02290 [Bacteroidetes bacterium GWF2_33_16]